MRVPRQNVYVDTRFVRNDWRETEESARMFFRFRRRRSYFASVYSVCATCLILMGTGYYDVTDIFNKTKWGPSVYKPSSSHTAVPNNQRNDTRISCTLYRAVIIHTHTVHSVSKTARSIEFDICPCR